MSPVKLAWMITLNPQWGATVRVSWVANGYCRGAEHASCMPRYSAGWPSTYELKTFKTWSIP